MHRPPTKSEAELSHLLVMLGRLLLAYELPRANPPEPRRPIIGLAASVLETRVETAIKKPRFIRRTTVDLSHFSPVKESTLGEGNRARSGPYESCLNELIRDARSCRHISRITCGEVSIQYWLLSGSCPCRQARINLAVTQPVRGGPWLDRDFYRLLSPTCQSSG